MRLSHIHAHAKAENVVKEEKDKWNKNIAEQK